MANGSMLSQQLLQYLVPQYDQAAKEYNSLTGTNTFDLIGNGRTGLDQFLYTVYDNTLRPIGQMIAEDWDAFLASSTARYTAYKNDGSLYNAANYFLGGIPDAVVSIGEGYKLRAAALQQNQDASSFLNWLTSGFSGQFEAVVSTPMSDPDYWRATRNIVGTGTAAILGYKGFSEWNISQNPHSTEWLIRYSEKMAGPPGKVPPGTFDSAFDSDEAFGSDHSTISAQKTQEIIATPKGERPAPSEYLSQEYIERHLKQFENGGSIITTKDSYDAYIKGRDYIGYTDNSQFIMPKNECDAILNGAESMESIEQALGFETGHFESQGGLVRIDIDDLSGLNPRIPSGNEMGANEFWIPGGQTSGGIAEAVVDQIPQESISVTIIGEIGEQYE